MLSEAARALRAACSTLPTCEPPPPVACACCTLWRGTKSPHTVMPVSDASREMAVASSPASLDGSSSGNADPHRWRNGPHEGRGRARAQPKTPSTSMSPSSRAPNACSSRPHTSRAPMRAAADVRPWAFKFAWAKPGVEWAMSVTCPPSEELRETLLKIGCPATSHTSNGRPASIGAWAQGYATMRADTGSDCTCSMRSTTLRKEGETLSSASRARGGGRLKIC
mmetsp:Transcript_9480/g.27711  ORF Transcript_9480/g.27711 Transcript_9480/m.27711 type:complete len:224 (-) Transcript_9480:587-1258(-)